MKRKLMRCQHCGGRTILLRNIKDKIAIGGFYYYCIRCGCHCWPLPTEEAAYKRWEGES